MPRPPATQFSSLTHLIQQTAEKRHLVALETPLTATVVASFLDRIEFVEPSMQLLPGTRASGG